MKKLLRRIRDGIRASWREADSLARDGKPLWLWLLGAVTACAVGYLVWWLDPSQLERAIRLSGLCLQFLGLGTVVWGLNASRKLFNQPSVWWSMLRWLWRVTHIFFPPRPKPASVAVTSTGSVKVSGIGAFHVSSSGSIEERLARLEKSVNELSDQVGNVNAAIRDQRKQMDKKLKQEATERETGDKRIGDQLEEAVIGGIHLEVGGLAYLLMGIWLATMPEETAAFLQCLFH